MMTAASIPASSARGYAEYLDGKTAAPQRGDYYLGPDGTPAEAPGRWLGDPAALARVGVAPGGELQPDDLRALMAGRRRGEGEPVWLRAAGPDGTRAGGIDVTFSAPKGVSVAWALGEDREAIEAAHHAAVEAAVGYLREAVELTVRNDPALGETVPAVAAQLHAAEFMHTTARGVGAGAPDPQLHSHVVITSVEREDGSVAAVRSRPVMRGAREVGAYYRAHLAQELRERGYEIEPAGEDGRYFSIGGVDRDAERAFSARTEEVQRAGREFRALHGRDPERGELRDLAVRTRGAKVPRDRGELDRAWRETGRVAGVDRASLAAARGRDVEAAAADREGWTERVERNATATRAIFGAAELRTVALEQAAGHGFAPRQALGEIDGLRREGRVLDLEDGRMTTARVRAAEHEIEQRAGRMAVDPARAVDAAALDAGIEAVQERLGSPLTVEQRQAVQTLTAPGRVAVLVGPAGTGKGVVIDAAAHAEQAAGREVHGVAVAGRTAQRLGESAAALEGRVRTIDGFIAAVERGDLPLDARSTVYVDEAGMGDTERLHRLVRVVDERGGSLVAIGDARQLPSVGAGGMFARLADQLPVAELTEVHRAADPGELEAWRDLRDGDPAAAMAHYRAAGRLHIAETRVEAVERAARAYDRLAGELGHEHVALMSDASNVEIDTLNLRIQALRHERGELTPEAIERENGQRLHGGIASPGPRRCRCLMRRAWRTARAARSPASTRSTAR
jgi:conjugative relaxase-like TrwC/TraI family protein